MLSEILAGYAGVTDLPPVAFLEELVELYPDAKFVLVTRDSKAWYQSFGPIMESHSPFIGYLLAPLPGVRWAYGVGHFFNEWYQHVGGSDKTGKELMGAHREYVRRIVPREKLLEMELGEGWGPLCEFLGKPVPKGVPFPKLNEAANRDRFIGMLLRRAAMAWMGIFAAGGVLGYGGWRILS